MSIKQNNPGKGEGKLSFLFVLKLDNSKYIHLKLVLSFFIIVICFINTNRVF